MRGIPGSGKTQYQEKEFLGATVCSADLFFTSAGVYKFDRKNIEYAHQYCWLSFLDAIKNGDKLVVVDNTNIPIVDISPYVLPSKSFNYEVKIITIECDPEVAATRNIHNVDRSKVLEFHKRLIAQNKVFPKYWNHIIIQE